ncbi:MAG: hypothetical protein ABMA13_24005, partial [Chthoniobacteraceae bacterium]
MSFFKGNLWPFRKATAIDLTPIATPDAPATGGRIYFRASDGSLRLRTPASDASIGGDGGADARELELQAGVTHIQWRYVGEEAWTNLIALAEIEGPQGAPGANGANGANGTEIELQKTATHIQWRYVGGAWTNLVALADITGPAGADGGGGAISDPHVYYVRSDGNDSTGDGSVGA